MHAMGDNSANDINNINGMRRKGQANEFHGTGGAQHGDGNDKGSGRQNNAEMTTMMEAVLA